MIELLKSLCNDSKYVYIYEKIVVNAISRIGGVSTKVAMKNSANRLLGYVEAHHIVPKSIAPMERLNKNNLVYLTPKEHFICHLLLVKMFKGSMNEAKMLFAVSWLSNKYSVTSVTYSEMKKKHSLVNREKALAEMKDPIRKEAFVKAGLDAGKVIRDEDTKAWVKKSMGSESGRTKAKEIHQSGEHRKACSERELSKSKEQRSALAKQGQLALMEKLGGEDAYKKYLSERIRGRKRYVNIETGQIKMLREPIDGFILAVA